jgi:hypothetical protein
MGPLLYLGHEDLNNYYSGLFSNTFKNKNSLKLLDLCQALKLTPHPDGSQSTLLFQKGFSILVQSLSIQQLFFSLGDFQTAK